MKPWIIRDNIYGNIIIEDEIIIKLINCKEFQRLRRILQLAGAQFVFPSATHTRFSHSIGVYHLINKIFEQPEFKLLSSKEKLLTKIAGLLHDLGHGPFSHSFEKICHKKHEELTIEIIRNKKTEINQTLKESNLDIEEICQIINKKHKNKALLFLVSSQLDCDRMDYLLRDSINTGVEYGRIDLEWIIQNIGIKGTEIVFDMKSKFAIENYLLSRYHMYSQVYNHKVGRSFDYLLETIFKRLCFLIKNNFSFKTDISLINDLSLNKTISLQKFLELDDYQLITIFKSLNNEDDSILYDLTKRLINRNFFKYILLNNDQEINFWKNKIVAQGYEKDYYLYIGKMNAPILYNKSEQPIIIIDENSNLIDLKKISELVNIKVNKLTEEYILIPKEVYESK